MADSDHVRDLFDQALQLQAGQRAAFLEQASGGDEGLRGELERLVGQYERVATVFETDKTRTAAGPGPLDDYPQTVGPYRILREIAHGGMGTVYLAVRDDDEYKKRVAIKLLHPGVDSDAIIRRFRQERQMLASIDHPFIAKLLDGGSTRGRLPYLVMEYVEGQPIDQYCDSRRLSIDERLELFRKVCTAVHVAHQNLIVHRDLKPSNILVTADGIPKLVDFGIAKPLNPEMFALTVDGTALNARMMTPEYASPEQVRGETVTTASDVYSLGVLLYELLTGHRPYRLRNRQFHEIARVICDEEPTRPSTVVGQVEEVVSQDGTVRSLTPEAVSRTREGTPERLRRKLRGDLENIVLMAMRKEPQRRYPSADQLSEDIRRHRERLPVRARKSTWMYRASKFSHRHRVGLGISAVLVIALIGFSVITARERSRAEREAAKANAVIDFLTTTLAAVDPRVAQGNEPTVRDMFDEAERRLSSARGLPFAEESAVRRVIAESHFQLGHFRQARDQYERLRAGYAAAFGDRDVEALSALVGLAAAQAALGELKTAEANARLAVDGFSPKSEAAPRWSVKAMNTLASVLMRLGTRDDLQEAERVLIRSAALAGAAFQPDDLDRQTTSQLTAELRQLQSRFLEAEPLARECYRVALSTLGPRHPATIEALETLSGALLSLSRYNELLTIKKEHVAESERILGADHPMTLQARHTVAETLRHLDRFDEALEMYEAVLADKTRVLGPTHRSTLHSRHNYALLQKDLKQPAKAEEMMREVARLRRETLGPLDVDTLSSEMMVALTLYQQRRLEESRDAYADVLTRMKSAHGESAMTYLVGTVNYAGVLYRLGDYTSAEETFRAALAAHEKAVGTRHLGFFYTSMELGTTLVHLKRYEEAEQLLLRALAGFTDIFSDRPGHNRRRDVLKRLVNLYQVWEKPEKVAEFNALLQKAVSPAAANSGS
jgi:serine/threonine-protein kinase